MTTDRTMASARVAASARGLLARLIDYAGLYPPAQLGMDDAVRRYAAYRASDREWMLGRFIAPAARLAEFAAVAEAHLTPRATPWRLSVVSAGDAASDVAAIAAFNAAHRGAQCDALEIRAANTDDIARIARAVRGAPLATYVELPTSVDAVPLIEHLATHALRAKIRTGGVTPDAFPSVDRVAAFLSACVRARVPFKATAGLHHPVCGTYPLSYEPASATGNMFGFLNVFLAAALLHDGGDLHEAAALLGEQQSHAFNPGDDAIRWRAHRMLTARLVQLRERCALSFGSCSFDEPVDALAAMGWL